MDDYLSIFLANKGRDNVILPENPGIQVEKTGKSFLLEKGRKIEMKKLNEEIKTAILITRESKINAVSKSGSSEEGSTLRRINIETQSLLSHLKQSTDKLYLQQAMNLCNDLISAHEDICKDENPLDVIKKIIKNRLTVLERVETAQDSNAILIKPEHTLLNDANSNLSESLTLPVPKSDANKQLSTESSEEKLNAHTRQINSDFHEQQNRKLIESEFDKVITRVTANRELLAMSRLTNENSSLKEILTDFLKKSLAEELVKDKNLAVRLENPIIFLKHLTNRYHAQSPRFIRKSFLRTPENPSITDKKTSYLSKVINNTKENKEKNPSILSNKENLHQAKFIKETLEGSDKLVLSNANNLIYKNDSMTSKEAATAFYSVLNKKESVNENKMEKELFVQLRDILKKISINNNINKYLEKIGSKDLVDDYLFCEKELKKSLNLKMIADKLNSILKRIIEHELAWKSRSENPCDASIRLKEILNTVNKLLEKYKVSAQQRPSKTLDWLENYREKLVYSEQLADKECRNRKIVFSNR